MVKARIIIVLIVGVLGLMVVPAFNQVLDVNGDDTVGPHEALEVSRLWKQAASGTVGSATNADLLDGLDSTQFLRRDVSDQFSGMKLTIDGALDVGQAGISAHDVNIFGASPGSRLFWDASLGAFRVGRATEEQWDAGNIGLNSVAMGYNTTASGVFSTAMGIGTTASGFGSFAVGGGYTFTPIDKKDFLFFPGPTARGVSSTAMGSLTTASGNSSTAVGRMTRAIGRYSTAMGSLTTASGKTSTAMGGGTTASGNNSTAMGTETTASGLRSTAMGQSTTASGTWSTAMGLWTTASGVVSTAMGIQTTASGDWSTAMGREIEAAGIYSVAIALNDQNGTVVAASNTMSIMGGNVGIGSVTPTTRLHVEDNVAGFVLSVTNDGNSADRDGIVVQAGSDDGSGITDYLLFLDGDGDPAGALRSIGGGFVLTALSDRKSKTNIRDTEVDALAIIEGLRVVDFDRKSIPDGPTIHGFIAQEAQEVFPEMVTQLNKEMLGISKDTLIPILTRAMQEQQKTISEL